MFSIIVALVALGLVLWLIGMLPLDPQIHQIIRVVAIVAVVLWLISMLLGVAGTGIPALR